MAKVAAAPEASIVINASRGARNTSKVRFGSTTFQGPAPSAETVERNIRAGQAALGRGVQAIAKAGVKLKLKKGVPRYSADPDASGVLIRNVDGKIDRVVFENGEFRKI